MKFLINASNLHVGGGVQVATSLIGELTQFPSLPPNLVVWASDSVDANLRMLDFNLSVLPEYEVVNSFGWKFLYSPQASRLQAFDAVYTLFGPLYVWKLSGKNIMGFAQPWIIYPDNEIAHSMGWLQRFLSRLKFSVQAIFFRKAGTIVVELEHVRSGLLLRGIGSPSCIEVVHNSLSSLYTSPFGWQEVAMPDALADIKLGFVGRNYAHKNTRIFPAIIDLLQRNYQINARVYVTFTDEEWAACDDYFRASVCNVGPLLVSQCPTFYSSMDAIIFPSLLECFSATPLEAMAMKKPLFASDRPFNRDVCGHHAHYFDPLSAESAANIIADTILNGGINLESLEAAREHAINFSSPKKRAEEYLSILYHQAEKPGT